MDTERQSYRMVLANKPFQVLWINEILVQLAYNMVNFALIIRVFSLTGHNTTSSLFVIVAAVPALLFGLFTGVFADIFDKRRILLLTDCAICICFFLFVFVQSHVALILLISFCLNTAFQFFIPAEAAAIPMIVPKKQLLPANALFYFVITICMIIGDGVAGPMVTHAGYTTLFILAGGAMFIGLFLRRALPPLPGEHTIIFHSDKQGLAVLFATALSLIKEGLQYIYRNVTVFVPVAILVAVQLIAFILVALGPGFMEQILHVQAADASQVLLLPLGLGLVVGALLIGRFGHQLPRRYAIVIGMFVAGLAILGLGLGPALLHPTSATTRVLARHVPFIDRLQVSVFVACCALLLGAATAMMVIPAQTILQNATNLAIRGRIFSIVEALKAIVAVIPVFLVGTLADQFGITPLLISIGSILLLTACVAVRFMSFERHLPRRLQSLSI